MDRAETITIIMRVEKQYLADFGLLNWQKWQSEPDWSIPLVATSSTEGLVSMKFVLF